MDRPSLASQKTVDTPIGGTGQGPTGSGTWSLVTALAVDDNLNYTELSSTCDTNVSRCALVLGQGNLSIEQPGFPVLAVCTPSRFRFGMKRDTPVGPTPSPAPTSSPSGATTYIVAVDIGWFSLSVIPLSGAATTAMETGPSARS